jgi:N-acetylglutamate synthase-like GNAT family acetyltransferase
MNSVDCSNVRFQIHERPALQGDVLPIDMVNLVDLFNQAAFWARDRRIEDFTTAIRNSYPVVTAHDGDRLIGFARATSDGVYRATVWDVVIHPDYQGAGLGRRLVETVLMHPHVNRAERVYLMTTNQQKFYERIGFEENKTTTLVLFNRVVNQSVLPLPAEVNSSV